MDARVPNITPLMELKWIILLSVIGLSALLAMTLAYRRTLNKTLDQISETLNADMSGYADQAWRRVRKIMIFIVGMTIFLIAIPIALLPGPGGLPVAIGGLMILAIEFEWARRLLKKMRKKFDDALTLVGLKSQKISNSPATHATPANKPHDKIDEGSTEEHTHV